MYLHVLSVFKIDFHHLNTFYDVFLVGQSFVMVSAQGATQARPWVCLRLPYPTCTFYVIFVLYWYCVFRKNIFVTPTSFTCNVL